MTKTSFVSKIGLIACIFLSTNALADSYKSANFAFEGKQLVNEMKQRNVSAIEDVLYCRADLAASGSVEKSHCYSTNGNIDLTLHTSNALQGMSFSPAQVNGEAIPVRMSFRVAYQEVNGEFTHAVLLPNLGSMQAKYGQNYIAPQERLDVSDWYDSYKENSWIKGNAFIGDGSLSSVSTTVKTNGKPSKVKAIHSERAFARDTDAVKHALKQSRFIPGSVDGKVVNMPYLASVHYSNNSNERYVKAN